MVEAIAVTPGVGVDAVEEPEPGKARSVPHDAIKLRLTSGLAEKRWKFENYCLDGLVRSGDPRVVAINAALVPVGPPRIGCAENRRRGLPVRMARAGG